MNRPHPRASALAVVVLGLTVVTASSQAAYLSTIGPAKCCATHCPRRSRSMDAERCCLAHHTVAPATPTKVDPSMTAPALVSLPWQAIIPRLLTVQAAGASTTLDGRAPPGASLVAQHSSLLL